MAKWFTSFKTWLYRLGESFGFLYIRIEFATTRKPDPIRMGLYTELCRDRSHETELKKELKQLKGNIGRYRDLTEVLNTSNDYFQVLEHWRPDTGRIDEIEKQLPELHKRIVATMQKLAGKKEAAT